MNFSCSVDEFFEGMLDLDDTRDTFESNTQDTLHDDLRKLLKVKDKDVSDDSSTFTPTESLLPQNGS